MNNSCSNCKFYTPINNRGQRYPKGFCGKHFAYRLSDKYQIRLSISSPYEYVCDLHELSPQPTYALVNGELFLVPPVVAQELISKGWMRVQLDQENEKLVIKKQEEGNHE